jgi:hypothetical protein
VVARLVETVAAQPAAIAAAQTVERMAAPALARRAVLAAARKVALAEELVVALAVEPAAVLAALVEIVAVLAAIAEAPAEELPEAAHQRVEEHHPKAALHVAAASTFLKMSSSFGPMILIGPKMFCAALRPLCLCVERDLSS